MTLKPNAPTPARLWIAPPHRLTGRFDELNVHRDCFHHEYASLLNEDPRMRCRVLDIGCGNDHPRVAPLRKIMESCASLDGVDPQSIIADHPGLSERWQDLFEDAEIPADSYDAIFTFWVVEHVQHPARFMRQASRVLKPGGVIYGLTASSLHPFAWISRVMQMANLKYAWRRISRAKVNDYPAYYRMNRPTKLSRLASAAGFAEIEIWRVPCRQWENYFPALLRFLPRMYDRLVGCRLPGAAQVLIFRATMPGDWKNPAT